MSADSRFYRVSGTWPFPRDMLRHDHARAATPGDQTKIDKLSGEFCPDDVDIKAIHFVDLLMPERQRPNRERWQSFGWSVIADLPAAAATALGRLPPTPPVLPVDPMAPEDEEPERQTASIPMTEAEMRGVAGVLLDPAIDTSRHFTEAAARSLLEKLRAAVMGG